MEITATAYRILKYLNRNKSDKTIPQGLIFQRTYCGTREEFNTTLESLVDKGLIKETKSDAEITPTGIDYILKLEHQNEELAYEDVFDDYDYSLLKYLYVNNWGVLIKEFPDVITKEVPIKGSLYDDSNLISYLYSKRQYIDQINHCYKLNKEGIRYYQFLTDRKNAEKEAKKIPLVVGNNNIFGDSNTTTTTTTNNTDSNNTTTTLQKPDNKKWYMVARDEAIKIAVVGIFALLGGFLAGKSCNQSPLQNQIQNSTHDSLQRNNFMNHNN